MGDEQAQERRGRASEADWVDGQDFELVDVVSDEEEETEVEDDHLHRVTKDGLYIGSMNAANNLNALQAKGITHVLMVLSPAGLSSSVCKAAFETVVTPSVAAQAPSTLGSVVAGLHPHVSCIWLRHTLLGPGRGGAAGDPRAAVPVLAHQGGRHPRGGPGRALPALLRVHRPSVHGRHGVRVRGRGACALRRGRVSLRHGMHRVRSGPLPLPR